MKSISTSLELSNDETISITLVPEEEDQIEKLAPSEVAESVEAAIQIDESGTYEYSLPQDYKLKSDSGIIRESNLNSSSGRIVPNTYVGKLDIDILDTNETKVGSLELEVKSVKLDYRSHYQDMLEDITEVCTELLMQYTSPANQAFTINYAEDASTLYQRFAFLKSVLNSDEFKTAIHRILANPDSQWQNIRKTRDIRAVRRFERNETKQLAKASNRIPLDDRHDLRRIMDSIPRTVTTKGKIDSPDTPENRFIKYALKSFRKLCGDFKKASRAETRLHNESEVLEEWLDEKLNHSWFQKISRPDTLPLNSPILQRKEGYREILRVWLMINLAARLTWKGGRDVYEGGKRDVATLYEYWVFFKLLEIVEEVFGIKPLDAEELIEETSDKLGLKLKAGKHLALRGIFKSSTRDLNIEFNFNRTFRGDSKYPEGGSWTRSMRPDYTLTMWPYGVDREQAEKEELIVHIHFDAKYRVDSITKLFGHENEDLDTEKEEESQGNYRRADLMKMHTYRDAIRRSAGAYVLYPGTDPSYVRHGYHEIIPGLGAFTLRPEKGNLGGEDLSKFLQDVLGNFLDRISQYEQHAFQRYETFKSAKEETIEALLPEPTGKDRSLLPNNTSVLVGYYHNEKHLNWIRDQGLYNTRTGYRRGSLKLGRKEAGAQFILLHTKGELVTDKLLRVTDIGPTIYSKQDLIKSGYPKPPSTDFYLVYQVGDLKHDELRNVRWDIRKLKGYKTGHSSPLPFATTLADLMKTKEDN